LRFSLESRGWINQVALTMVPVTQAETAPGITPTCAEAARAVRRVSVTGTGGGRTGVQMLVCTVRN